MVKPVVIGYKIYSEHTLIGYDMRDGESTHSIERLPYYMVEVLKDGSIVLEEDAPIVRCVFGPFKVRSRHTFAVQDVTGLNYAAIAYASQMQRYKQFYALVFAHRPDEKFSISQGKVLPEGVTAAEIDEAFMKELQYSGEEIESFYNRRMLEEKTKRSEPTPVSMDDIPDLNMMISPSLSNTVPETLKPVYTPSKPLVHFNEYSFVNAKFTDKPQPALFALTENPEYWMQIADRREEFSDVTLFSSRLARQTIFNEWVKTKVLEKIFLEHPTDFKEAYVNQPESSSVFAVDSQTLEGEWVKDFLEDNQDRIYVNFLSRMKGTGISAIGPGTMYANPALTRVLKDHPRTSQVHQGIIAAQQTRELEATLNEVPFNCFIFRNKPVCEFGIVGQSDSIWEVGDPEQDDYLGLWVDKTGRVQGMQVVGTKEQRKALLLQEAMLMGCIPKKHRFFADQAQWDLLEAEVTKRVHRAEKKPKFPTANRR